MFELLGLLSILFAGGLILGGVAILIGLLKIVFKVAMIPIVLGAMALKGIFFLGLGLIGLLVLGPIVLGLGLALLVPVLLIGAIVCAGVALVSIA